MNAYSTGEKILEVRGVNLSFSGVPVLRGLECGIHNITRPGKNQGQVVCLLGPSGVGKSQFFRILAGLQSLHATTDQIAISGEVLVSAERLPIQVGMVGVVPQNYATFPHRKVLGNLLVAGKQRGLSTEAATVKAMELLGKFGIADKANSYPAELSGGQRQRVSIIQQMMCSSHFLLMDEPFSGLDPIAKAQACNLILSLSQVDELNTSIVTTHDIDTAITVADTIWLMGRDRDERGNPIGARIQQIYDLAAMGLAWDLDIRSRPAFQQLSLQIHQDFQKL